MFVVWKICVSVEPVLKIAFIFRWWESNLVRYFSYLGCYLRSDGRFVSELDCQISYCGSILAPDFHLIVAPSFSKWKWGYKDLPWKLNAAERSADHIAWLWLGAEIWKRWTANTHCRNMSSWTCPSWAAKFLSCDLESWHGMFFLFLYTHTQKSFPHPKKWVGWFVGVFIGSQGFDCVGLGG